MLEYPQVGSLPKRLVTPAWVSTTKSVVSQEDLRERDATNISGNFPNNTKKLNVN